MKKTGDALIKTVEKEIWRVNVMKGIKSGKIISKPRLAQLLIEDRLKEIQIELSLNGLRNYQLKKN